MPRKSIKPPKTTKYGAPTVDGGFSVIKMTQMRFNDDSKSFEFEFELEIEGVLQCFWLTWEEANTFPQYQICFWFYIRDTIVRSRPGAARTILLFHTISVRPPKQPH